MKLWIEPELLYVPGEKIPAKKSLYVCTSLKKDGFELATDVSPFPKKVKKMFEQEELFSPFEVDAADAQISYDKSEGKYIFWLGEEHIASGFNIAEVFDEYEQGLQRKATLSRTTSETDVYISLNLDGTGKSSISTGLKFFDHMLEQIARHGLVDLELSCTGDLEVDEHHTIEDVGIALGEAITKALGNKKGIERYAFVLPMDESQATVALDLSGRPYLVFESEFSREYVGDMPTEMVKHFFYSLAMHLKATLHIEVNGENDHHKIEAVFKGFARCLKTAIEKNPRIKHQIPSSKGAL